MRVCLLAAAVFLFCGCGSGPESDGRTRQLEPAVADLQAGIARLNLTPEGFERFEDLDGDHLKGRNEPFYDTGLDGLFDHEEPGAYGPDGQPGRAGADDDGNGVTDDPGEYLSPGSDDVADPHGDNFHPLDNPAGTEGDGVFQAVVLAGFEGLVTGDDIRPALEIHDALYATSLAVTVEGKTVLLMSLDLVGFWYHYLNPIKRRVEQELGVPFENIVIASTHTHAGPDSVGLWAYEFDSAYPRRVMDLAFESARAALAAREPARLRSATVLPPACYDKATLFFKDDRECTLAAQETPNFDPSAPYDRHVFQNDLRDPWVRNTKIAAMQFNRPDGSAIATLVNFHNHTEVFGKYANVISSDFPHYTRAFLEERFGGLAIYFTGTCGSQIGVWGDTPVPYRDPEGRPGFEPGVFDAAGRPFPRFALEMGEDKARSLGLVVGEEAARGLAAAAYTAAPRLEIRTEPLDVVPENLMSMGFSLLILLLDPEFPQPEDRLIAAGYCPFPGCARVPVSVIRLGDASLVAMPGEVAPEYLVGRPASAADYPAPVPSFHFPAMPAIEDYLPGRDKFLLGQANGYFGYFVPASDFLSPFRRADHPNYYEDELCPGPHFGDAVGNKVLQMLGAAARFSNYPIRPRAAAQAEP